MPKSLSWLVATIDRWETELDPRDDTIIFTYKNGLVDLEITCGNIFFVKNKEMHTLYQINEDVNVVTQ